MWAPILAMSDEATAAYVVCAVTVILSSFVTWWGNRDKDTKDETEAKVAAAVEISEIKGGIEALLTGQEEAKKIMDKHICDDKEIQTKIFDRIHEMTALIGAKKHVLGEREV